MRGRSYGSCYLLTGAAKDAHAKREGGGSVGPRPSAARAGCPRLFPAVPGCPRRGPQVAGAARRFTGSAAGRERERQGGQRPMAALLSLQVEFLPERDLESDGTKISVSVAAGRGQSPPAGGPFPIPHSGPPGVLFLPHISSPSHCRLRVAGSLQLRGWTQ